MKSITSFVLPPLSAIYSALMQARIALYQRGALRVHKLEAPVISVGNMTTGGTGKTPLVEWVSRALAHDGKKVCILTRGYGRANPDMRVVVSDGAQILVDERQSGDEPFLLAQNLKGLAAVVCDADRVSAGQWAIKKLGIDALVLDDGFQQLRLARDLNIVTVDATNPWGGNHLLPYGRLREPLGGLSRADCVVVTRADQNNDLPALQEKLRHFSKGRPIFISRMQSHGIRTIVGEEKSIGSLVQPFGAFCSVGNPESFFSHLSRAGYNPLLTRAFPDHYAYGQDDVDLWVEEAKRAGAKSLITTAKDAVKLHSFSFALPCYFLEIQISLAEADQLLDMIRKAVSVRQAG
jgi:tetraacyldisaccharide 4'-kinase